MDLSDQQASVMTGRDSAKAAARPLFLDDPIEQHPLFAAMEAHTLDAVRGRNIALDIHHVVAHFPRFLSAVMTSIEDYRLRMTLVQNLYCEHGAMNLSHVHLVTYQHFLRALGISDARIASHEPSIGTVAYVRAVLALCQREDPSEALAALAVIEEVVARVSPIVGRWGRLHGVTSGSAQAHFGVHEVLDLSHAEEIYDLAGHFWEGREASVRRGLALGMYYQRRLYTDLLG